VDRNELLAEAARLDQGAALNDMYARKMEETAERTNGALGCFAAPNSYAAHLRCAAEKRARAAALRAQVCA